MTDASNLPSDESYGGSPKVRAAEIAARYECQLSDDLIDWIDSGIWTQSGFGEYHMPVDPALLMDAAPEILWPGLMPYDFLPLIGSGSGDWLGVRVDADNRAREIIQWYHGGGDWISWGHSIAKALVFAAVADRLPGPKRKHAIPAEQPEQVALSGDEPWLRWACRHVDAEVASILREDVPSEEVVRVLLHHAIAEPAVRCELLQDALSETLSTVLTPKVAQALDIDWNTAVEWMFDVDRIPKNAVERLAETCGHHGDDVQDWREAVMHSRRVTTIAPELAWGWDLLGYSLEKLNKKDVAIQAYLSGSVRSIFTDQSVRLRTHWTSPTSAKFSTARLMELAPELVSRDHYLQKLNQGSAEQRRIAVQEHWLAKAAEPSDDIAITVKRLIAAGWDLGAEPMTAYGDILQRIAETAQQAGQVARSKVAAAHRECLQQRFGV